MTLKEFIRKRKLSDDFDLNRVPLKHPETGSKIYLLSTWHAGFWYRRSPGRGSGRMEPCQYRGSLEDLHVHPHARREVR